MRLPLARPRPDARAFIDGLLGRTSSVRVPLIEYLVDPAVQRPIIEDLFGRSWTDPGPDHERRSRWLENIIAFWHGLGYDVVRFEQGLPFAERTILADDRTATAALGQRAWADEHRGTIRTWADFDRTPWPEVGAFDFFTYEYLSVHLPEGMGFVASHAGGPFEHLSWIMSYEGLCFALIEQRDLVRAIADRLGRLMEEFYRHLLDLPNLVAVFPGDDMGFKTGPLISPDDLRAFILPWHKRYAAMAHDRGIPYFLHSCGNLETIMDDLVGSVGIDGKHSFEDAILPADVFQGRYGHRVATLGGVDVNILARGTEDDVRRRTKELIGRCGRAGRFAVGSGNSIPSYVPAANYLAMVDEALRA